MSSLREAKRAKEQGRKAKLKGTSLRSLRPPPRPNPHRTSTFNSQAGPSYQSYRSIPGSHYQTSPVQEDQSMDVDGDIDEDPNDGLNDDLDFDDDLNLKDGPPPPPSSSTRDAAPLFPSPNTYPAALSSPRNSPLPGGLRLGELAVPGDPQPGEPLPLLVEPSDDETDNEPDNGDGNNRDYGEIKAGEGYAGDAVRDLDRQEAGWADDGLVESEDERPWFLAMDDDDGIWQVPSPSDPGSPARLDDGELDGSAIDLGSPNPVEPSATGHQPIRISRTSHTIHHPSHIYVQSHSLWFVRIILVVTVYLHFSFHLPFAACNVLLFTISYVLRQLKKTRDSDRMPITLITAIKSLGLGDQFTVYPACPVCHRIERATIPAPEKAGYTCPGCDTELFSSSPSLRYLATLLEPFNATASRSCPQPKLVVSYRTIPALLSDFLSRDGMVKKMDAWREKDRVRGRLGDVMDGRIWKELEGPDKKPFFGDHCPEELRVGLVVHLDWCNFRRSAQSPNHSTGLFSLSVANLPESERYQTRNLLVPCIIPGPKEPNTRQLQEYIILMVDEFLDLYEKGMDSPAVPDRLVRAAVTLVICDHPAMCKFFGFADKRHENSPCHRCHVKASEWSTDESLSCGYRTKTLEELRVLALAYRNLPPEEQEKEFKKTGVRWFAFLKLPYFNPLRMAVLDPMHNILLGVVKTQWYEVWIKTEKALRETTKDGTKRELEDVHSLLRTAEFPDWLGRIPSQVGIPAGGSLSADEWKALVLVFGPLALPVIWDDWIDAAQEQAQKPRAKALENHSRLQKKYEKKLADWEKRQAAGVPPPPLPDYPPLPDADTPRLKHGEMELFLKLCAALTVLLARTVYLEDLEPAHKRLLEYLHGYVEMYGSDAVKPNFHWATHLYEQILDYGPVYGFWAFLQERLNFIVKGFRTNNHGQGELEVTMMRSYSALTSLRTTLASTIADTPQNAVVDAQERSVIQEVVKRLLAESAARGTIEAMAQSPETAENLPYMVGPQKATERLNSPALVTALLRYINSQPPFLDNRVHRSTNPNAVPGRILSTFIIPVTFMVLDGRKIVPLDAMRGLGRPSIVQARWGAPHQEKLWVGELLKVFLPLQEDLPKQPLAAVHWLKPANSCPLRKNIWEAYKDALDVKIWEYQVFVDESDETICPPPAIIPFSSIVSQAARITVRKLKGSPEKVWLTIGLDKHGTRL